MGLVVVGVQLSGLAEAPVAAELPAATDVPRAVAPSLIRGEGTATDFADSFLPPDLAVERDPSPVILLAANGSPLGKPGELVPKGPERIPHDPRRGRPTPRPVTPRHVTAPGQLPKATAGNVRPSLVGRLVSLALGGAYIKTATALVSAGDAAHSKLPLFFDFDFDFQDAESPFAAYEYRAIVAPDGLTAHIDARLPGCGVTKLLNLVRGCPEVQNFQRITVTRESSYGPFMLDGVPVLSTRDALQTNGDYLTEFSLQAGPEVLFPQLGPYTNEISHGIPIKNYGHWLSIHAPWAPEPIIGFSSPGSEDLFFAEPHNTKGMARVVAYRADSGQLKLVPPGYRYDSRAKALRPINPSAPSAVPGDFTLVPDPEIWKGKPSFDTDDLGREMRESVVWRKHNGEIATHVPWEEMVWKANDGRIFDRNGTARVTLTEHADPNATRMAATPAASGSLADRSWLDDPAKERQRALVMAAIKEHLLPHMDAKDIKVLHFAGKDAVEAEEYMKLGIPAENIYTVEKSPELAAQINASLAARGLPPIQVIPQELGKYIAEHPELDFDVVSLDDYGPMIDRDVAVLHEIIGKLQARRAVIHVAHLARRDGRAVIGYKAGAYGADSRSAKNSRELAEATQAAMGRGNQKTFGKDDKAKAILEMIDAGIDLLREDAEAQVFGLFPLPYEATLDATAAQLMAAEGVPSNSELTKTLRLGLQRGATVEALVTYLKSKGIYTTADGAGAAARVILDAYIAAAGNGVSERVSGSSYKYTSVSGAPMIGSVVTVGRPSRTLRAQRKLAVALGFPRRFRPNLGKGRVRALVKEVIDARRGDYPRPTFVDLGGAKVRLSGPPEADPEPPELTQTTSQPTFVAGETISKEDALALLRDGVGPQEIAEAYPGTGLGTIRAWKAHLTMGKYD